MIKNKKILHLTDGDLEELIKMYYSGAALSDIKEKYSLQGNITNLPLLFPSKSVDKNCVYCVQPMQGNYPPRSRSTSELENVHCVICGHKDDFYCTCVKCKKIVKT